MRTFYGTKHFMDFKKEKGKTAQDYGRLISYVRLRADGNLIDPRFSILLNTQTPEATPRTKLQVSHQPYVLSSLSMNDVEKPYYEHDVYGPFTRVFLPNDSNQVMANDINEVVDSLNSNKDVCTISLGPSGSGKTSTLIYFRGSDTLLPSKGVIPLLMNKLDRRFTKVRVTAFEFAANYDSSAVGTANYWKNYDVFESPVIFKRKNQEWESERPGLTIETFSYSSAVDVCEKDSPFDNLSRSSYTFNEDSSTTIGDFLSLMIDIRLNCGTPMNPVSSRTHLFLFLKFLSADGSENDDPTLIVADLAGREKSFDCSSEGILEVFSLNKYYPTLNKIVNDPLGQITDPSRTPLFDRTREKLGFPATAISVNLSKSEIYKDIINPLSNYTLTELFNLLHLDTFFSHIKKNSTASG
ncbi:MAG: hypothetical protein FJ267_16075, partial [Planctomycetes bacterium]|nr:hypothetical protein [Planctomycetota bacterium]